MIVQDPDDTGPLFAIVGTVSPTLLGYTKDAIVEELWHSRRCAAPPRLADPASGRRAAR